MRYETRCAKIKLKPNSVEGVREWAKTLNETRRDEALATLRDETVMVEQYKAKRIGVGRAPATVNRELSVLSKVFTLAVRHEKADVNPCQSVERFALDNERVRYLTEDEEERLFEAMGDNELLKSIVTVAFAYRHASRGNLQLEVV